MYQRYIATVVKRVQKASDKDLLRAAETVAEAAERIQGYLSEEELHSDGEPAYVLTSRKLGDKGKLAEAINRDPSLVGWLFGKPKGLKH